MTLIGALAPVITEASVTSVWSPNDAAAATAWLSGTKDTASRQHPNSFYYFTTDSELILATPIIANLSVWSNRAELNILGLTALPSSIDLWVGFLGLGTTLEISQRQLALANPEGDSCYFSYTSSFSVDEGFSRFAFNSAAEDGLLLIVESGTSPTDTYSFRLATIPEPTAAVLFGIGSIFILQRRGNRRGKQAVDGNPH